MKKILLALLLTGCNTMTGAQDIQVEASASAAPTAAPAGQPAPATPSLACSYPSDPTIDFGVGVGQTVPLDAKHTWQGIFAGETEPREISVAELFDCDGSREVDAVIFETSQYG